ncbi:MAG TPA: DNA polymerase III subunit delta [Anaerolineaceae bacterium]
MDHPIATASEKPVVEIIHGDDPYAIRRHIAELIANTFSQDKTLADYNVTRLDGRQASDDDLRSAANAIPFFTERRLVILTSPFSRLTSDAARKRFIALLDGLPSSTTLVLVIEDTLERRGWKSFPATHFVQRWSKEAGKRAHITVCQLPPPNAMPEHIRKEARALKGQFSPEAAAALAAHIGNDTQLAALEIEKLLLSVDFKRPVEVQDVEELTAQGGQGDVFAMVDALAIGNSRQAIGMLHRLMEVQEPLSLFGMIVRQFRLLVQARELMDEGKGSQLAAEMHQVPFVADKLAGQARHFNMAQLEDIYHRLLLVDEAMKTSQMPQDLALDTFVAEQAR